MVLASIPELAEWGAYSRYKVYTPADIRELVSLSRISLSFFGYFYIVKFVLRKKTKILLWSSLRRFGKNKSNLSRRLAKNEM